MAKPVGLRIDLRKLAAHLAAVMGESCAIGDAVTWLHQNGFEHRDDFWIGDSVNVGLLDLEEILAIWEIVEPGPQAIPKRTLSGSDMPVKSFDDYRPRPRPGSTPRQGDEAALLIPKSLIGTRKRDVSLLWRRLARRAIKDRTWQHVVRDMEFVHIDDSPFPLVVRSGQGFMEGQRVHLDVPINELTTAIDEKYPNPDTAFLAKKDFLDELSGQFWPCLCFAANTHGIVFHHLSQDPITGRRVFSPGCAANREDYKPAIVSLLRRVLAWWPVLCQLDGRYVDSAGINYYWPRWGTSLFDFCCALEWDDLIHDLFRVDPDRAGIIVEKRLRDVENRQSDRRDDEP